jgi:AMMECR1 domain-containing protein
MQQSSPLQTKRSDVNSEAVFLKVKKTALRTTELRGCILET